MRIVKKIKKAKTQEAYDRVVADVFEYEYALI